VCVESDETLSLLVKILFQLMLPKIEEAIANQGSAEYTKNVDDSCRRVHRAQRGGDPSKFG
jgi:hypothetical protein